MDLAALGFSLDTRPLEKGKKHLEELAEAAGKAEGAAEELGKSNRKAGEDAKKYGQDTKSAAEETERLAREQQKASEATRGLSGLLGGLAISFSGLMIARDATNVIAEFSKEVANLRATLNGTPQEMATNMAALREQAKLVGSTTSFSLAEVAKTQRVLAQAGLEAQDILRATPDVLKFAEAGDFKNLEDAAELLVDVSSQTGKTAKDFRQLSDVMVATADTSTTSAQQLAFGYKYSATLAKEMGTEFKETSAALALLTNNGIKGESAGTALRGMMMSLLNPTNEAEKLFKKLGFNLNELNPAANGLIPALSKLQEKAISMPDLAALFGTEGATAASILTKQYDKLGGMIDKIGDSAGITDRKSRVMSDNLKAAMASIASAAEAAAIEISDRIGFEEFAKNASQNISGVIGELSGLNDRAREAGTLAEEQAQKYADMGNALKAAGVIAGGFVALQLPAMFAATATAITSAAVATKGFTLALASNPFGLAAVAITTLTAAAIYYQDEIVSVGDTTATVGDAIMATWEETGGVVLQTAADILSYFSDAMSGVSASSESSTSAIQTVWYYTGGAIIEAIKMAVNYALNAFPAMRIQAEATANAISAAFMRAAQFDFSGAAKAFTDATGKGNADAVARLKQDNFAILTTNIAQNLERKKGVALAEKEVQSELKRLKASQEAFATTKKTNEAKKGPTGRTDVGEDKKSKKAADETKKLAAEQEKLNNLLQKGSGFSASYAESLALLAKHQDKIPVEEYRAAVERLILAETDAGKAAKKHAEELAKLQEQFAADDAKRTQSLQWQAEELTLQASLIGKTSTEQAYLVAAFEAEKEIRSQIIELTQDQARYEREGNAWAVEAIENRIAKLQDEAQARKDAAGTLAAQKAVLSGWQSVSSDIERALTDSLMRGFENGENFVDSLKNYIKNAFKSFSVKLLLQPVMGAINSIGGPIYSQMMGGQQQQGQGGSFDLGKMFSDSKSSYDSFIDTGLKSSVGQSLGFSTPLTYTDAWAAGQNVSGATVSAGAELTSLGEAASTAGQALGYLPAVMQAAEERYVSAVGSAVGQYFGGPIGSMAGAAIGGLLDDAFGFGEKKPDERRARFGYGASEALVSEGKQTGWTGQSSFGTFRTYADKWFSDSEMRPAMSAFVDSLESLDNAVADSLKLTADQTTNAIDALKAIDKEYSFGLQWGDFTQNSKAREQIAIDRYSTILDSVEAGWGDFVRGFAGTFDQFPAYLQSIIQAMQQFRDAGGDVTRVFGQQVNSIKEFERFAKSGETSAAAFQRLYGVFQITNRVLESLGKSAKGANLATADLRESFVRLAGGMEQLQGYLTEYYDGFYTEAERTAVVMADLQKEFDKYGATVPKTREEWRKLMESLDLSTDFGQQAAVKLYQLQGAFLSVTKSTDDLRQAQEQAADDAKRAADQAREDALRAQQEAEDAARQAVEDARQQVEEAYNREADAIRTTIDRLEDFIKSVRDFRDSLYLDSELSTLSKYDQYQFARQKFEEVQAKAMAGDPEALAQLEQSSRDFLEYSKAYNANNLQYQQDFDRVQSILSSAQATAQSQLSAEQAQLSALNQMVSGILQVNDSVMSLSQAIANYNSAMMALQTAKAGTASGGTGVGGGKVSGSGTTGGGTNTAGTGGTGGGAGVTVGNKDYGITGSGTGYQKAVGDLLNNYLTKYGYTQSQIENFGRGMLDANGNFVDDQSKWSENKWLYDQFKQELANLGRVSDSEIRAFAQSGKTNEQIYAAAQEFGISAARLSEVLGVSKEEIKSWVAANGLAQLTPDEVYRAGATYNPDIKAIQLINRSGDLLTTIGAGTGGVDYANLDRLGVDPKEWQKAVGDLLKDLPANADYVMQDALNYAPSKFFSAGSDKSFLKDIAGIDVEKEWEQLFNAPDMPSVQSFAKAAGLDFSKASDMLNSSGVVLRGLIDWAKVMTSSDPAKSLQSALNAISEDKTLQQIQSAMLGVQGYVQTGSSGGIKFENTEPANVVKPDWVNDYQYTPSTPSTPSTPQVVVPPVQTGPTQADIQAYVDANRNDQMAIYNAAIANGVSGAQVAAASGWSQAEINAWADANGLARFADGGMHTGGLRLVGENGPELEVTGPSRIYNASQTQSLLNSMTQSYGTSDKAALIDEIKALRQEVVTLRSQMATAHQQDLQQREAIAEQSAQLNNSMARTIQRTVTLNI